MGTFKRGSLLSSLFLTLTLATVFTFTAQAADRFAHEATLEEAQKAKGHNKRVRAVKARSLKPGFRMAPTWAPVLDTADFGYVLMSSEENYSSEVETLRKTIAENLPDDVKLVILSHESDADSVRSKYSSWISPDRLIIASARDPYVYNGFWARDSFPLPVMDVSSNEVRLISARYFRDFNSGGAVAQSVHGLMEKTDYVFVGGNLLADESGNCFTVDSRRLFDMTEDDLKSIYGCRDVHLMEHVAGIGDVDEVLKPLGEGKMLLTATEYKSQLEGLGYEVIMLPSIRNSYRTYANSLIVGNTVFMPSFGISQDQQAQAVYEKLGYEVIPIRTNHLSDDLRGSIHCQTMAYPRMDQSVLFRSLNIKQIH